MATDTRITLLQRTSSFYGVTEQTYIYFSPSRDLIQKEVSEVQPGGSVKLVARGAKFRGTESRYRSEIRSTVRSGWVILSSDQTDI